LADKTFRKIGSGDGVQPTKEESTPIPATLSQSVRENVPLNQEVPPAIKMRNFCDICKRQVNSIERSFFDGVEEKKTFICDECWERRPSELKPISTQGGLVREPDYAIPKFVGSNPKPKPKKKGGGKWRK
jgi:hypothetical protein